MRTDEFGRDRPIKYPFSAAQKLPPRCSRRMAVNKPSELWPHRIFHRAVELGKALTHIIFTHFCDRQDNTYLTRIFRNLLPRHKTNIWPRVSIVFLLAVSDKSFAGIKVEALLVMVRKSHDTSMHHNHNGTRSFKHSIMLHITYIINYLSTVRKVKRSTDKTGDFVVCRVSKPAPRPNKAR